MTEDKSWLTSLSSEPELLLPVVVVVIAAAQLIRFLTSVSFSHDRELKGK